MTAALLSPAPTTVHSAALAGSGAATVSAVYRCNFPELLGLWLHYTSAGAAGAPHIRVMVSAQADEPLASDLTLWRDLAVTDGLVTEQDWLSTGGEMLGEVLTFGQLIRLKPTPSAEIAQPVVQLRARVAKWVHVRVAEIGNTGAPGTLVVELSTIGSR